MNSPRIQLAPITLFLAIALVLNSAGASKAGSQTAEADRILIEAEISPIGGNCGTQVLFDQRIRALGLAPESSLPTCTEFGPCDAPWNRDLWSFESGGSQITVQLAIHVVAHDDGANPFATPEQIQAAVDSVNRHFFSTGIQFVYTLDEIRNSEWRALDVNEINDLKIATASDPTEYLNIWITSTYFGYAFGTFPWDDNAQTSVGGIIIGQWHWGGNLSGLAHEIGHCLGLWHNFHGVAEVEKCGPCYESVTSADRDILGDWCADTPPSPDWRECSDAVGIDSCAGLTWGGTQPENVMGYAPTNCRTMFTPQQAARMRCWTNDQLAGWTVAAAPCCVDRVGDANNSGDDEPTIGDITLIVDAKFASGDCDAQIICKAEADVNQSGGIDPTCADITISDISALVDYLFITGPMSGSLLDCF